MASEGREYDVYVVVAGMSEAGRGLFAALLEQGHEVAVVDRCPEVCGRLAEQSAARVVCGDGTDLNALDRAGAGRADVLVAATGFSDDDLAICHMARRFFAVPWLLTLVAGGPRAEPSSLQVWSALLPEGGPLEVVRFRPDPDLAGRTVGEIERDGVLRVAAICRGPKGEDVIVPTAVTPLRDQDLVIAVVQVVALPRLRAELGL